MRHEPVAAGGAAVPPAAERHRPPQRALVVVALAASAVAVGHGFGRLSYPFLLPAMVDSELGTYARAGLLGMANLGAYLLGVLVVISRASRVSLAGFLRVGLLGVTAGLACLALAPGFPVLLLGMVLAGGFNAAVWIPASALVASAVPRARGLAAGALGVGYGLAIVAAGGLTRAVQSTLGEDVWRPVWGVLAVVAAAVLVAVTVALRPVAVHRPPAGAPRASALRRLPGAGPFVTTYACFALGYVVYASYLVAALEADAGLSSGAAAAVYGITGIMSIVGGVLVGRMSDWWGRRRVLVAGHALMALSAVAVLLGAQPWVGISAAVFGLFSSGLPAVVAAYVADHLEPAGVAAAFGVVTIAFGVSQTVGPPLAGWLADTSGAFTATFTLSAAAHAVGAAAALLLPRGAPGVAAQPRT